MRSAGEIFAHRNGGLRDRGHVYLAISAWYLLRRRERDVALRSFAIGSVFGTLAIIGTLRLGDSSAYEVAQVQPVKLAAMGKEGVANEPYLHRSMWLAWPNRIKSVTPLPSKFPRC
ncbi:cytochrome ubiquinol oxidase subunit I [Shigella flexneri]